MRKGVFMKTKILIAVLGFTTIVSVHAVTVVAARPVVVSRPVTVSAKPAPAPVAKTVAPVAHENTTSTPAKVTPTPVIMPVRSVTSSCSDERKKNKEC